MAASGYLPAADANGPDEFTYQACDPTGLCDPAIVSIAVQPVSDAPTAGADSYSAAADAALVVEAPGVLVNDADGDGDPLTAAMISAPAAGTVALAADGSFTYTPAAGLCGIDSFTYEASDGKTGTGPTEVRIDVGCRNVAPAAVDDAAVTDEDVSVLVDVLANDGDDTGLDTVSLALVSTARLGDAVIEAGRLRYTPRLDRHGTDTVDYQVCDREAACSTATVTITVSAVNDAPIAAPDAASTVQDTSVTVDLVSNDDDVDGDELVVEIVTQPAGGTVAIGADQAVTYTPTLGACGPETFTYRVSDGTTTSAESAVSIEVTCTNQPPVAVDDSAATQEDTPVTVDVLGNDGDDGGPVLAGVEVVIAPSHGTAVVVEGGAVTYTPSADWHGTDTFTYRVADEAASVGHGNGHDRRGGGQRHPGVHAGQRHRHHRTSVVLATACSDVDGDLLGYQIAVAPTSGTASIDMSGRITATPSQAGTMTFAYTASDGAASSAPALVQIEVTPPPARTLTVTGGLIVSTRSGGGAHPVRSPGAGHPRVPTAGPVGR